MAGDPEGVFQAEVYKFFQARDSKSQPTFAVGFYTKEKFADCLKVIDVLLSYYGGHVCMMSNDSARITAEGFFIMINFHNHSNKIHLDAFGDRDFCVDIKQRFGKENTQVQLTWWYIDGQGDFIDQDLDLQFEHEVHDEYYPYISGGLSSYFESYRKSPAPILLLIGEPGVGKTSFIKQYIKQFAAHTVVTYDNKIMASDNFYLDYLTNKKSQLLVIEDADLLLAPREEDNPVMAKLLNLSNGLITLESKKIIFSTNITIDSKIDTALIRPGRCFDILKFRTLTYEETKVACTKANLPVPSLEKEYALSEIFNQKNNPKVHKIGFGL